jgi:pimeloyl-ACP methyl ester carboxylesterase
MPVVMKTVEVPNRVTLPFAEQGDRAGMPVILLHGVTDSWRSFERVLPHLPPGLHAFALTQRGHGDAERPETGYRTRDFAADLAGVAHTLGCGPALLVGHSMGSTHALRFAIDYPELTRGLVLVGAFATYKENAELVKLWETGVSPLTDPIDPGFVREFQESTLAHPVPPEFLDAMIQESLKLPARVWRAAFAGFYEDDFAGELDKITAPTLLIWGDRDVLVPRRDQDILLNAIKGSRLVVYEDVGHAVHWEQPVRFAADVAAFAGELGTTVDRRP